MTIKEQISKRYESNAKILDLLAKLIDMLPEQRFGQIMSNYVLPNGDPFFEESVNTLERIKQNVEMLEKSFNEQD